MRVDTRQLLALLLGAFAPIPVAAQRADSRPITLAEAITRGRSSGVQAVLARFDANGALTHSRQRNADRLPAITATSALTRQTVNLREFGLAIPGAPAVTDPFTLFRGKVVVEQLLYSRSTLDRLRMARDSALARGLDAERVGELASATAATAWLRLVSAQETVLARQQDSAIAYELIRIAGSQVDAGTAARIERTRTETQGAAIRAQLAIARNEVGRAQLELAQALDLAPGTPLVATGDPTFALPAMPTDLESAIAAAKAGRPDLAAEQQRARVTEEGLRAIRDEFWPTLATSAMLQSSGLPSDRLYGTWSIGVGLSWPLFDGFRRERRADEQRIRLDAAHFRVRALEQQVESDARMAMLDVASAREQVELAAE